MSIPTSPDGIMIDGVVYPDTLSTRVHYYNALQDVFVENAMVFAIGSLCVTDDGDPKPSLTVQSHCLIRFGMILLHDYHYNTDHFSAPGDPSDPAYPDSVPPAINPFLSFMGLVTHHLTISNTNPRTFIVDLSVYNNEQSTTCPYQLLCMFPESARWKNLKTLPRIGGYVQISGEVIGFCDFDNGRSLCVLITELSYLPQQKPKQPTTSAPPVTTTSPITPRKPLRRRGEQPSLKLQQQTPSTIKQPTPSTSKQPTPSTSKRPRPSEDDIIISESSYTGTIANEDENENDDDGNDSPTMGKGKRKKIPKVIKD